MFLHKGTLWMWLGWGSGPVMTISHATKRCKDQMAVVIGYVLYTMPKYC